MNYPWRLYCWTNHGGGFWYEIDYFRTYDEAAADLAMRKFRDPNLKLQIINRTEKPKA